MADLSSRLFSNLPNIPYAAPAPARAGRPPAPPAAATIDGTLRPWGDEWKAREARYPPEEGQEEGAPLVTPLGDPIRKLIGSRVFSHVHPSVGVAPAPGVKGLGLFAAEDLEPGTLVCLYTGVWAFESEIDHQFPRAVPENIACVHNYTMEHNFVFTQAEADRGRSNRQPNVGQPTHTGGTPKVKMQKLFCCARMSADAGGPSTFSLGLCNLQYRDAPDAPLCDAGALMNNSHPLPGNVVAKRGVCTPVDAAVLDAEEGTRAEHACLLLFVGANPIPAGTELEFNYGYDSKKEPERLHQEARGSALQRRRAGRQEPGHEPLVRRADGAARRRRPRRSLPGGDGATAPAHCRDVRAAGVVLRR